MKKWWKWLEFARWTMWNGYLRTRIMGRTLYQHRWVMEKSLGRELRREEHIHHLNGVRHDNRLDNLQLLSASDHKRCHASMMGHAALSALAKRGAAKRKRPVSA